MTTVIMIYILSINKGFVSYNSLRWNILKKTIRLITEIEVVSETTEEELQAAEGDKPQLTEGVTVAYTKPTKPSQVSSDSVGGGGG